MEIFAEAFVWETKNQKNVSDKFPDHLQFKSEMICELLNAIDNGKRQMQINHLCLSLDQILVLVDVILCRTLSDHQKTIGEDYAEKI